MPATKLNGTQTSKQIKEDLRTEIAELQERGVTPGLAAVLVGDNPASEIYVKGKIKACEELGLRSEKVTPPDTITTEEMLALIDGLNRREDIDGILVQLPLPDQVDAEKVLLAIDPAKDVDGFHPMNVGALVANHEALRACTPAGIMELLRRYQIDPKGKRAVIIGRSNIVGKPLALMLMHAHATITVCHSRTRDLPGVAREGDILVAAMGRTAFVTPDFVRPGAVVIDVGMNRFTDRETADQLFANFPDRMAKFEEQGKALVGDVHPDVAEVAGMLTPVPGGVGPLTIAMLMVNTVTAARRRRGGD